MYQLFAWGESGSRDHFTREQNWCVFIPLLHPFPILSGLNGCKKNDPNKVLRTLEGFGHLGLVLNGWTFRHVTGLQKSQDYLEPSKKDIALMLTAPFCRRFRSGLNGYLNTFSSQGIWSTRVEWDSNFRVRLYQKPNPKTQPTQVFCVFFWWDFFYWRSALELAGTFFGVVFLIWQSRRCRTGTQDREDDFPHICESRI